MLTDMVSTMASGFVDCVTQYPVGMSCPCPARSKVQQLYTVRYKATKLPFLVTELAASKCIDEAARHTEALLTSAILLQ